MSRRDSDSGPHGHHDSTGEQGHSHPGDSGSTQTTTLSPKDKLIIRLEHTLEHNEEHVEAYRRMAEEARQLGQEEVAHLIHGVAEQTGHQGEDLKKAVAVLKSS